jgi:F0F1-type ATP synthase membrane subunit b/b'
MDISFINIVLHAALFVGLLFVLKVLYVAPVLELLRRRDEMTKGKAESTSELATQISELKLKYESAVNKTKHDLEIVRQEQLARIKKESEGRLKKAQREFDQRFQTQYQNLVADLKSVRERIPQMAESLSQEIKKAMTETKVIKDL